MKNGLCQSDLKGQSSHKKMCLRHNPFPELPLAFAATLSSSKQGSAGISYTLPQQNVSLVFYFLDHCKAVGLGGVIKGSFLYITV